MELAKLTSKGQITVPIAIRKKLNLKQGDKVMFIEEERSVRIVNSSLLALEKIQEAFSGEAERLSVKSEQDVVDLVKEVRSELFEERYADND